MESCNLVSAVIYLENMHNQLEADKNTAAAALISKLVADVTDARNTIVNKSALAGAVAVDIYNPLAKVFTPAKKEFPKQKPAPTYDTIAGFTVGETKEVEMNELLDLIGEIAAHADSNRFGTAEKSSTEEDLGSIVRLLKAHLGDSGRRVKVELSNQVIAKTNDGTSREALGKFNRESGVLSIALSPKKNALSSASVLVSTGKVVLHELVHAMTVPILVKNKELNDKVEFLRKHAVAVYKNANGGKEPSYEPGSATYGLKNTAEFVAEVITSKELQKLLAGMNATKTENIISKVKAVFKSIVAEVKRHMGIPEDTYTLLDEALEVVTAVLDDDLNSLIENEQDVVNSVLGNPAPKEVATPESERSGYEFQKDGQTFTTNEGQTEAIDAMKSWYTAKDPSKPHFLLQGRGGTGKTTVINVLMEQLGIGPSDVTFATPTHKALKVIRESNKDNRYSGSEYKTIASLLGVRPKQDSRGNIVAFEREFDADDVKMPKILIIDEASMVHSVNYQALLDEAYRSGTRLVFMGDHAQLAPVKDAAAKVKSVVFSDLDDSTVHLNQLMRQAEDSPIIRFTDGLISIVNAVEADLEKGGAAAAQANANLRQTIFDGDYYNSIDETTGDGVMLTTEDFDEIFPQFMRDYESDPVNTKYIHFNNHAHKNTVNITNKIREKLFGKRASEEAFIKGEPLILNSPTTAAAQPGKDLAKAETLDNGEEFTTVGYELVKNSHVQYTVGKATKVSAGTIDVYKIKAKDNVTGEITTFLKPVNDEDVEVIITKEAETLPKEKAYHAGRIRAFLATGLGMGYVINAHKAQGSTYETVYMDIGNIIGQYDDSVSASRPKKRLVSANDKIKAAYVGASRPKKRLIVMDRRGSKSSIVNSGKLPYTGGVFKDMGTVGAAEINKNVNLCQ